MGFIPPTIPGAQGYPLGLTGATAATRYVGGTTSGAPASGTFAVGDFVIDETGAVYVCTVAGSPGTWTAVGSSSGFDIATALLPSGALAATIDPRTMNSSQGTASGLIYLAPIVLPSGLLITSITFWSAAQAAVNPTHQVFGLYDTASGTTGRALLRSTADDTTTAWAANTAKTLALTSTYTTTRAGLFYIAIVQTAATTASVFATTIGPATAYAPIMGAGDSGSGYTALPNPTGTLVRQSQIQFAYVS